MPISHEKKIIFVHIPKTGGTSIEYVLGLHGDKQHIGITPYRYQELDLEHLYGGHLQHLSAMEIKNLLPTFFNDYKKFTFVRNPWDRMVSEAAWLDGKWAKGISLTVDEFDRIVRELYVKVKAGEPLNQHERTQLSCITDSSDNLLVEIIGKYETMEEDWKTICEICNIPYVDLPIRMQSIHGDYHMYYTEETKQMVAEIFAEDIEVFQYAFD